MVVDDSVPKEERKPGNGRIPATIDIPKAIGLLAAGIDGEEVAKQCGASSWHSLRTALAKRGITKKAVRRDAAIAVLRTGKASGAMQPIQQAGLKSLVHQEVEGNLHSFREADHSLFSKGQGKIDALHKLAQTAALVEGWGDEKPVTVVGIAVSSTLDSYDSQEMSQSVTPSDSDSAQVVDIESDTQKA